MRNLYIWFEDEEERRDFVIRLFEIKPHIPKKIVIRTKEEAQRRREQMEQCLYMLRCGKYSSPYLRLQENYKGSSFDQAKLDALDPWNPQLLYCKGFRRIYILRSYFSRPGFWLVLKFADNQSGKARYQWVMREIPKSRLGLNVPKTLYSALCTLKYAEERLQAFQDEQTTAFNWDDLYNHMLNAKQTHPELYSGSRIYLWEQLAAEYEKLGRLEQAKLCYLAHAELRPGDTGPYLNMGVMYGRNGMVEQAIKAYSEGLKIDPQDEYLYYNLASLLAGCSEYKSALRWLNRAILANPQRGISYRLKGDIHFAQGNYHAAIECYKLALTLFDESWKPSAAQACYKMALAFQNIGFPQKAMSAIQQGLEADSTNSNLKELKTVLQNVLQ